MKFLIGISDCALIIDHFGGQDYYSDPFNYNSNSCLLKTFKSLYLHLMNAENIKELRKQLGLNQKEFADKMNVTIVKISKWEREIATPRKKHMAILKIMGKNKSRDNIAAYRPIQYLGSKLRLLNDIKNHIDTYSNGNTICDLFSGSGVVSNYLSSSYKLVATDIQEYSCILTNSLLDNKHLNSNQLDQIIKFIEKPSNFKNSLNVTQELINYENKCLNQARKDDVTALVKFSRESSLYIHKIENNQGVNSRLANLKKTFFENKNSSNLIITNLYGGVYFSYEQAVYIDVIRQTVQSNGKWNKSIKNLILAALISTASEITNTVGKQFAQPMKLLNKDGLPKQLLIERTIRDKNYSVLEVFKQTLKKVNAARKHVSNLDHEVFCGDSLDFLSSYAGKIDCFYADPPYTIDHYSRFYHVLETITKYDSPILATMNKKGAPKVMNGLYRIDRHQSSFCIPSQVKDAFSKMIQGCASYQAPLIISYSPYDHANDERPRLLKTQEIKEIAHKYYKSINIIPADGHIHRKLHSTNKNTTGIENCEVFIICSGVIT